MKNLSLRYFLIFLTIMLVSVFLSAWQLNATLSTSQLEEAKHNNLIAAQAIRYFFDNQTSYNHEEFINSSQELAKIYKVRFSYITNKGIVLVDTGIETLDKLDNHADRPELTIAQNKEIGQVERYSKTLKQDLIYTAIKMDNSSYPKGFIRIATATSETLNRTKAIFKNWFEFLLIIALFALAFGVIISKKVNREIIDMVNAVENIAHNPQKLNRLRVLPSPEFAPLADAVNLMAESMENNMELIAENKAQLETILNIMNEGVLVLGLHGRIRLINNALTQIFPNITSKDYALGKLALEIIPIVEVQEAIDLLILDPNSPEMRTLDIEIDEKMLSIQLLRLPEMIHEIQALIVFHDISELTKLMRIRRDFVANVSHELRTPLTVITGYAETLMDMTPTDISTCKKFATIIHKQSTNMNRMVQDLLDLSRIENGSLAIELAPLAKAELSSLVSSIAHVTLNTLKLELNFPDNLHIQADRHLLSQVFRNLFENAARYAPEDSTVEVNAEIIDNQVTFSVSDQGSGIATKDLSRVFERFYKVDKTKSTNAPKNANTSTGLGLAICKHIIERHKGIIWAENNHGAIIKFRLNNSN